MSICEEVMVEVASVDVNDDYRVELTQLRKVTDYSPAQARDLANLLVRSADRAEETFEEHQAERRKRLENDIVRSADGVVLL